jgi:hypothetical protein
METWIRILGCVGSENEVQADMVKLFSACVVSAFLLVVRSLKKSDRLLFNSLFLRQDWVGLAHSLFSTKYH